MGRRTLVVVPQSDGRYDCRVAHWGVDGDPIAQSRPLGTGWSASTVGATLDARYEAVVVCDGRVQRYCVCWLDPTLRDADDVAVARTDDPESFRAWWVVRKSRAADAVARGVDPQVVRDDLRAALDARADAWYWPDDAPFLRADG
ncbi:hypothetical protein [Haloarcula marina]|uniref:hypothetical protein n=1 Tax=Haloarcula marina TaxID=2961574 RepID=UPI0020B780A8|nr:hypothetical protein [Halomicroarcula marina]